MAQNKKRVEWGVHIHRYNLTEQNQYHPRVALRGTVTLADLAARAAERLRGMRPAMEMEMVGRVLMEAAEDFLVEGYAVDTQLGRLTPVVTGMWGFNRIDPKVRAQNGASVSYALSSELKKAFSNPLFHEVDAPVQGPWVYDVFDLNTQSHNRRLTPGGHVYLKGRHLLLNGDLPERGVELLDAETEEVVHRFDTAFLARYLNSRSRIVLIIPADLPDGLYRLAVTTQCTTGPKPLQYANRRISNVRLRVGEEPPAADGTDASDGRTTEESAQP